MSFLVSPSSEIPCNRTPIHGSGLLIMAHSAGGQLNQNNLTTLLEAVMTEWGAGNGDVNSSFTMDQEQYQDQAQPRLGDCGGYAFPYTDYSQVTWVRLSLVCCYCVVMALALLGNSLVIWTVVSKRHMRTVTNCYILNLAVADLLVSVFVMPLKLLEYTAPCSWKVFDTDGLCSLLYYIEPVIVFTGVLTLVAISVERYHAVVHPFSAVREDNKKRMHKIIAATWLVPLILGSPFLFAKSLQFSIYSQHGQLSLQICTDRFAEVDVFLWGEEKRQSGIFRRAYFIFLFLVIYLLPTFSIVGACIKILTCLCRSTTKQQLNQGYERLVRTREKNKRKVARMVMIVALTFVLSWTPFYVVTFVSQVQTHSFLQESNFIYTMLCTHLLGFANSCINPFIYSRMSDKFRRSFRMALVTLFCCFCKRLRHKRRRFRSSLEWNQPSRNEIVHYRVTHKSTRKTELMKTSSAFILTNKSSTKTRSKTRQAVTTPCNV